MYTVIGFSAEHEGFCASREVGREVSTDKPQEVANYLENEFGIWFDQILLVVNGENAPEVAKHWNIDKDYVEV